MSTFANSEDPSGKKDLPEDKKNSLCFENYNLTPLDMYNGLSKVYCIKSKGRIH